MIKCVSKREERTTTCKLEESSEEIIFTQFFLTYEKRKYFIQILTQLPHEV